MIHGKSSVLQCLSWRCVKNECGYDDVMGQVRRRRVSYRMTGDVCAEGRTDARTYGCAFARVCLRARMDVRTLASAYADAGLSVCMRVHAIYHTLMGHGSAELV